MSEIKGYVVRKRLVYEAMVWTGENLAELRKFAPLGQFEMTDEPRVLLVNTLYGREKIRPGFYVVKSSQGRTSCYPAEQFEQTYELSDLRQSGSLEVQQSDSPAGGAL